MQIYFLCKVANHKKKVYDVIRRARNREDDNESDMIANFISYIPDASDKYLRDILVNFILAGRDTTASTLAWCLYYLATNPKAQEKLYEEISMNDKEKTTYLSACIKEALRLSPPVAIDPKAAIKDDVLPSGVRVKAGDIVEYSQWNLSRCPELFGEDCEEYKPERWIEDPKMIAIQNNKPPFIPFQYGPRICLGMRMALEDMHCCIEALVRRFRFLPTNEKPKCDLFITLVTDTMMLKVERRN